MKLIPYTNVSSAIPAFLLLAVNVTNTAGPVVQLATALGLLIVFSGYLRLELRTAWILLAYVAVFLGLGFLEFGVHQSVLKAGKLGFFCLVSVLSVRGSAAGQSFPALVALRAFLALCAVNFLYAGATGQKVFRSEFFIEFSIYSAYTIAFLVYLARPGLTLFDRGAAIILTLLCGSTMGLFLLFLAELVGRRFSWKSIAAMIALAPIGWMTLDLLMEVRGKELTLNYLATSDRGILTKTFFQTVLPQFGLREWLLGVGVGQPLHEFRTPDDGFNGYLTNLGEGEVYAFCLHNEVFRLLCDFGLVGVALVGLRLWANCPKPMLILLGVCLMTNSYLYSFSGALIASCLFHPRSASDRKRSPQDAPASLMSTNPTHA